MPLRTLISTWPVFPAGAGGPDRQGRDIMAELGDTITGAHVTDGHLVLLLTRAGIRFNVSCPVAAGLGEEFLGQLVGLTVAEAGDLPVPVAAH